jgi:hypothetical protein
VIRQTTLNVLFARYSAQELAAASESLLFGIVGDIDQRISGQLDYAQMASKQVSRNLVSYQKSSAFLVGRRRHEGRGLERPTPLNGA